MLHWVRRGAIWLITFISLMVGRVSDYIEEYSFVILQLAGDNVYVDAIIFRIKRLLIDMLRTGPLPTHVSFIMDGNRRYARGRKLSIKNGHEAGGETLLTLVYICKSLGIKCVSAYAFSIENFSRPKEEVDSLMGLFSKKMDEFAERANDFKDPLYGCSFRVVGDMSLLDEELKSKISNVESKTEGGNFILYLCFPYTSRNDIAHAVTETVSIYTEGPGKDESELTIRELTNQMYFGPFSNKVDLLIRTSGHMRLSDYMLWQINEHSTIEFSDTLWPQFSFLQMYLILLKWSMFRVIQNYNNSNIDNNSKVAEKIYKPYKRFLNLTSLSSLPEPPIAVSIVGGKD
ncbi:Dehydrodolichyl diphosphate synthase complex subunit SRT1 [Nakaseomyces bracarensis]|uniref:Alkyl transferase n=1 Tax=Nakaseomyces bracarensis TaxID=273131 RepID=A0ABR4NMY6_9SACH